MKEGRKRLIKDLHSVVGTVWQTSIETEFPKLFKGEDTKIEVDKWYRYKDVENWMVKFTCADKGSIVGYGLNCNSEPMEDWTPSVDCLKGLVLCSEEEAKQSLIKAAKKIGVKVGAKVRCLMNGSVVTVQEMEFSLTEQNFSGDFWVKQEEFGIWCLLFTDGKWATIVTETITKEQAEKELGKTIVD